MKNDWVINLLKRWRSRLEQTGYLVLLIVDIIVIGFVGASIAVDHFRRLMDVIQTPPPAVISFAENRPEPPHLNTRLLLRAKYPLHRRAMRGPTSDEYFTVGDNIARHEHCLTRVCKFELSMSSNRLIEI